MRIWRNFRNSPPEPPVPAVDLQDLPPMLQLHRPSYSSVTRFNSPQSLIPPPEPRRPPGPPSEPPIPLPEFSVSLPESLFSTTEHPGAFIAEPLVSLLELPVPLLNSRFHRWPPIPLLVSQLHPPELRVASPKSPLHCPSPRSHHPRPLPDHQSLQFSPLESSAPPPASPLYPPVLTSFTA